MTFKLSIEAQTLKELFEKLNVDDELTYKEIKEMLGKDVRDPKKNVVLDKVKILDIVKRYEDLSKRVAAEHTKLGTLENTEEYFQDIINLINEIRITVDDRTINARIANDEKTLGADRVSFILIDKNNKIKGFKNVPKDEAANRILDKIKELK